MIKLKQLLRELDLPPLEYPAVWLGLVDSYGAVHAAKLDPAKPAHSNQFGMTVGNRWRWRDDSNTVFWWEIPSDEEKVTVTDWMHNKFGFEPKHAAVTDPEEKSSGLGMGAMHSKYRYRLPQKYRRDLKEDSRLDNEELQAKVRQLERSLEQEFSEIQDLHLYIKSNGSLFIGSIRIKKEHRGKGIGSNVISRIKKFADDHQLILSLAPEAEPRYKEKLDKFYKSHGFVVNKGRKKDYQLSEPFSKTMYRRPGMNEGNESRMPDKSLGEFLLAHKTVSFSDWVYHGTPLVGLKEMLVNGISGTSHGEVADDSTFSTSVNSEIIHYFSEGDGETGLQFQVKNVKLLVVEDFLHKLIIELAGSGMEVDVDEQEFEQFCKQYNIPVGSRGEPYLPYGYLTSLGIDAFMLDYAWQRLKRGNIPHNDESEICFVGKGIDLLNSSVETIYVDGQDYDIKDKAQALQDIEARL